MKKIVLTFLFVFSITNAFAADFLTPKLEKAKKEKSLLCLNWDQRVVSPAKKCAPLWIN